VSSVLVRFSGLAAILGGVLGIVLTPILTYLWATNSDVYGYFGRAYFLVFLGCLSGLAGLYARRRTSIGSLTTSDDAEGWVFVLMLIGLVLALVGDVLEYWGGGAGEGFTQVQVKGFTVEIAGLAVVLFGSVAFGVIYRRANLLPRFMPWLLIAAGPVGLVLSIPHIPSGTMFLFCCAWVVSGYLLLTGQVASAQRPVRVT
jgi:hypothetical protein